MLLLICTCNKNVINIYNYSWKALKQNLHEMLKDSWSWTHSERKSGVAKKPFMCINYYILPQALFQGTWAGSKIPTCTRQLSSFSTNSLQAYSTEGDLQERGVALASTVIFAWYPFSAPNPPWKTDSCRLRTVCTGMGVTWLIACQSKHMWQSQFLPNRVSPDLTTTRRDCWEVWEL